jgi:hypothetical protein
MGPQPIQAPKPKPPAMRAAAERVLALLASRDSAELARLAAEPARSKVASIADAVTPGAYNEYEIVAIARTVDHYWIKGRLHGANAAPFTVQFRLGEQDGNWTIRDAMNLTGKRSGWTK